MRNLWMHGVAHVSSSYARRGADQAQLEMAALAAHSLKSKPCSSATVYMSPRSCVIGPVGCTTTNGCGSKMA
jgi:hypothetical protein